MIGRKDDAGKVRFSLFPHKALEETNKALEVGAVEYGVGNWSRVENLQTRYYDAAMRHIFAHRRGEKKDATSGLHPLAHAICCLMFMLEDDLCSSASVAADESE